MLVRYFARALSVMLRLHIKVFKCSRNVITSLDTMITTEWICEFLRVNAFDCLLMDYLGFWKVDNGLFRTKCIRGMEALHRLENI